MNRYTLHTPQSAPPPADAMLADLQDLLGFVPNVFAVLATTPAVLDAFMVMNQCLADTSLTAAEREIVQLAVSAENGCGYCVAGHTAFAIETKVSEQVVAAIRNGTQIEDPKFNALASFACALASGIGRNSEAELEALIEAGYRIEQVPEIILGVCVKMVSNLTSTVLGQPLDDAFQPYAWCSADQSQAA